MNFEQREKAKRVTQLEKRLEANPFDAYANSSLKMLESARMYVVEFESANYCGASENCLVWAFSEEDALDEATPWAEEFYREQDQSQWEDEHGDNEDSDEVVWASMRSAELLEDYEYADIVEDPIQQSNFYQLVN